MKSHSPGPSVLPPTSSPHPDTEDVVGGKHCIVPACLGLSLNVSLANMAIETVDIFYLHNAAEKQLAEVSIPLNSTRFDSTSPISNTDH